MAITNGGCNYGKGTRWGIGLVVGLLLTAIVVITGMLGASVRAIGAQANTNRTKIYETENMLGRVEERVKSIDQTTKRIESRLNPEGD